MTLKSLLTILTLFSAFLVMLGVMCYAAGVNPITLIGGRDMAKCKICGKPDCRVPKITASKYMGDDSQSWAVFVGGRPAFTGMGKGSTRYYKRLVHEVEEERLNKAKAS